MGPFTPHPQDSTVYTLAAQLMADAANDGDRARIDRALDLVATVERTPIRGLFLVPSASTEGGCYHVHHGLCNCPDAQRRDALRCKHAAAVQLFEMVERADAERLDPTAPIDLWLTPAALAVLDDQRQRDAARCPECNDWKQHGALYCCGNTCERLRPALRLVAARGAARQ